MLENLLIKYKQALIHRRFNVDNKIDAEKIERQLQKTWPKETWIDLSTYLIYHGRQACKPHKPLCDTCIIQHLCWQQL